MELAFAKEDPISIDEARYRYAWNMVPTINSLVDNLDFVCLQEMLRDKHPEHRSIEQCLGGFGFSYVGNERLGIAFDAKRFTLLSNGPTGVSEKYQKIRTSYYADIQHKRTRKIIRVVSAHLKGFNVKEQKKMTRDTKAKQCPHRRKIQRQKRDATKLGDIELMETLSHLAEVNDRKPDVIIIGLDANATAKYLPVAETRVHSFRLKKLKNANFECCTEDKLPTIFDKADGIARKFDYVFARTPEGRPEVSVHSQAGFNLQGTDHRLMMSDHVPVFAKVTIHR
jgi:endonuclease/exonuclease/phosphatase family metal-dependent hydrolase